MKRLLPIILIILLWCLPCYATVTSLSTRTSPYTCSGSKGPYQFSFPAVTGGLTVIETLNEVDVIVNPSLYAVSCVNNNCMNGGSITLSTACASGYTLTILRSTPQTQARQFTDGMPALYKSFENSLDKNTLMIQELQDQLDRAPMLRDSSTITGLPLPDPSANTAIGWNGTATALVNVPIWPLASGLAVYSGYN